MAADGRAPAGSWRAELCGLPFAVVRLRRRHEHGGEGLDVELPASVRHAAAFEIVRPPQPEPKTAPKGCRGDRVGNGRSGDCVRGGLAPRLAMAVSTIQPGEAQADARFRRCGVHHQVAR